MTDESEGKPESGYALMEQLDPPPGKGCRYRLVENLVTIDGARSRLTRYCTDSLEVAKGWLARFK